jgi:hypothetical protein
MANPNNSLINTPEFTPHYTPDSIKGYINLYNRQPHLFEPDKVDDIEAHANHFNIKFKRNLGHEEATIGSVVKNLVTGWASGYTTIPVKHDPTNSIDGIARSIGHLAGFVGYFPSKPIAMLSGKDGTKAFAEAVKNLKNTSVPMRVANFAQSKLGPQVDKIIERGLKSEMNAVKVASEFFMKDTPRAIAQGAFHLGLASGVSSWHEDVDVIMSSMLHGAWAGGAFKGIAEFINFGGPVPLMRNAGILDKIKGMSSAQRATVVARSLAGSLVSGAGSTIAGAPTEEQVYNYLLGAWFGFNEKPTIEMKRNRAIMDIVQEASLKDTEKYHIMLSPKKYSETYSKLEEPVKKLVDEHWDRTYLPEDQQIAFRYAIMEATGVRDELLRDLGHDIPEQEVLNERMELRNKPAEEIDFIVRDMAERIRKYTSEEQLDEIVADPAYQEYQNLIHERLKMPQEKLQVMSQEDVKRKLQEHIDLQRGAEVNGDIENADNNQRIVVPEKTLRDTVVRHARETVADFETEDAKNEYVRKVFNEVGIKAEEAVKYLSMEADITEMVEALESVTGKPANNETKREMYQWLLKKNSSMPVGVITGSTLSGNGQRPVLMGRTGFDSRPVTTSGTSLFQLEPMKRLQEVYESFIGGDQVHDPAYRVFEKVTVKTMKGVREMTLDELVEYQNTLEGRLKREERALDNGAPLDKFEDWTTTYYEPVMDYFKKVHAELDAQGMYYFGGRGDSHRWYVAKYHPAMKGMNAEAIEEMFTSIARKSGDEQAFRRNVEEAYATRETEMSDLNMKKSVISNVLYDISMNGLDIEIPANGRMQRKALETIGDFVNESKRKYGNATNEEGTREGDWIKNAVAFNKRMQIWFNSGVPAPANKMSTKSWRIAIVPDAGDGIVVKRTGEPAEHYTEATDGAITMTDAKLRELSEAYGFDPEMGFNKSFIVSPDSKFGALLGKYAIHPAGPELSKAMEEAGIDMYLPESTAKQRGTRQMANASYKDGVFKIDGPVYDLPIEHLRTVMTELNDHAHMTGNQRLAKQALSNLMTEAYASIPKEQMEKIIDETSGRRFRGEEESNDLVNKLMDNPSDKDLEAKALKNIEKIGLKELTKAIQTDGMESFAVKAYSRILKLSRELIDDMFTSGEMTKEEYREEVSELDDHTSVYSRMIESMKGKFDTQTAMAVMLHKYVNPYRISAVKNYLVNSIAKPQMKNSLAGRMIPYDYELQANKDVKLDMDTFYLGAKYKDMMVTMKNPYTGKMGKPRRMEEIYAEYQASSGAIRKEYEQLFSTLMLRVPMDSISGARVLKFGGFLNRNNHGILLHPEVMKALGGADLDGDKAFGYMGLDKTWLDVYEANKNEFIRYKMPDGRLLTEVEYQSQASSGVASIPKDIKKSIPMNFNFGKAGALSKGSHVQSDSTFDAIKEGVRTGTSRKGSQLDDVNIGDTVEFYKVGRKERIYAKVTDKRKVSSITPEEWANAEGYSLSETKANWTQGKNFSEYTQITYELIKSGRGETGVPTLTPVHFGKNQNAILSNFAETPFEFAGNTYKTAEGAYQALKSGILVDGFQSLSGSEAKSLGAGIRADTSINVALMESILRAKAEQVPEFADALIKSGKITHPVKDKFWATEFPKILERIKADIKPFDSGADANVGVPTLRDNKLSPFSAGPFKGRTPESVLAVTDKKVQEQFGTRAFQYSSGGRARISLAATLGRKQLGPSVVTKAMMGAMHSGLLETGALTYEMESKKGNKFYYRVSPKKDLTYARELGTATIAYGSDPLDVLGLTSKDNFFRYMYDAHFDVALSTDGKNFKTLPAEEVHKMDATILRSIGYNDYANVNSAIFGKNSAQNRQHTYNEVQAMLYGVATGKVPANTPIMAQGKMISEVNYFDNIMRRINVEKYAELVNFHNSRVAEHEVLQDLLGRPTMSVPYRAQLRAVLEKGLWRPRVAKHFATHPDDFFKLVKSVDEKATKKEVADNYPTVQAREVLMEMWVQQAQDFAPNDLTDMASIKLLSEYIDDIPAKRFAKIVKFGDKKRGEYIGVNKSKKRMSRADKFEMEEMGLAPEEQVTYATLEKTDADLRAFAKKNNLTPRERELLELSLLSSLRTGTSDTTTHNLGYKSSFVNNKTIRKFLTAYADMFKQVNNIKVQTKNMEGVQEGARSSLESGVVFSEEGKIKGANLQERPLGNMEGFDKIVEEYYMAGEPELASEAKDATLRLQSFIDKYGADLKGDRFPLFVRGLLNKEVNMLNLEDLHTINRALDIRASGTWFQRLRNPTKEDWGGTLPDKHWTDYMRFGESMSDDLMRRGFDLAEYETAVMTRNGWKLGTAGRPTMALRGLQESTQYLKDASAGAEKELEVEFEEMLSRPRGIVKSAEIFSRLYKVAVGIRERRLGDYYMQQHESKTMGRINKEAYERNYERALREGGFKDSKGEFTESALDELNFISGGKRYTARDVVRIIDEAITKQAKRVHKIMAGGDELVKEYEIGKFTGTDVPRYNVSKFVNDLLAKIRKGEDIKIAYTSDALSKMLLSDNIEKAIKLGNDKYKDVLVAGAHVRTGKLPPEMYYPHAEWSIKEAEASINRQREHILKSEEMTEKQKVNELVSLETKLHRIKGRFSDISSEVTEAVLHDQLIDKLQRKQDATESLKKYETIPKAGSSYGRSAHLEGWSLGKEVFQQYQRNIVSTYYRQLNHLVGRRLIDRFEAKHAGQKNVQEWATHFKLYLQGALGYPTIISKELYNDPNMKINISPYGWFADNRVADSVNKAYDALHLPRPKDMPKELSKFTWEHMRAWSNAEAMYQLSTLLAHPKASVANLLSGHEHTIINAGWRPFRKANDFNYINDTIGNGMGWRSMADVHKWIMADGVLPEFVMYELGFGRSSVSNDAKLFVKDAMKKIMKDPNAPDESIRQLAKKHGVLDTVLDKASWFMRAPERALRMRSYLAHYIQAYENFHGAIPNPTNSAILKELAKKGVKATQFLYNAPARPMFATTALGKVLTRFQLWGWNSVRFRKDIIKEAYTFGFKENTMEFDRFKRLALADIFAITLANTFMYSIFETALPAPWGWFQDTADWMFGDEKERDRAFFGMYPTAIAPLQVVTPPIARSFKAGRDVFQGLISRDWEKLASYNVYTMFPFGRILRDAFGSRGLVQNPSWGGLMNKATGLPYI